jgi:hypothetical protein
MMDLTNTFKILGWFNPRKWLTMFSKWWLKTESLEKERQYILKSKELEIEEQKLEQAKLESNRKKPTWCHACDVNMESTKVEMFAMGKSIGPKPTLKCPKCGLIRKIE